MTNAVTATAAGTPRDDLKSRIREAMSDVGLASLSPAILSEVTALSSSLRLSPSRLAESWEAHSLTRNVAELNEATMSAYRSALAKEAEGSGRSGGGTTAVKREGLGKRSTPSSSVTPSPAPKRTGTSAVDAVAKTPTSSAYSSPIKKPPSSASSVVTPSDRKPQTSAPIRTPKYQDRANANATVTSYNPRDLQSTIEVLRSKGEAAQNAAGSRRGCSVTSHPAARHPTERARHMFAPLEKRVRALEERLVDMGGQICDEFGISDAVINEDDEREGNVDGPEEEEGGKEEIASLAPVGVPKQNKVCCVGRICNEAHDGRLNRASLLLEGSRSQSGGNRIKLDVSALTSGGDPLSPHPQSYSLFPGQIVVAEGVNASGRTFKASRLCEGAAHPPEKTSAAELLDVHHGPKGQDGLPVSIVAMCGPYTTSDNLEYEPLLDAIEKIRADKPDVAILCGPFVDVRQHLVATGQTATQTTDEDGRTVAGVPLSHEMLFADRISVLLEEMYCADPELKTQFVLVPSVDDALCDSVYPQPPLVDDRVKIDVKSVAADGHKLGSWAQGTEANIGSLGLKHIERAGREGKNLLRRVHRVSNPCTLRINELTVGITSTDVLFHMSSDEANANLEPGTRLARIAQHLVQQRSYYPLFPAHRGACLDLTKSTEWEMPCRPDVLVLPSKLAAFARPVLGSAVAVNPGTLSRGAGGGTYAVLDVHPIEREKLEEATKAEMELEHGVLDRIRVDIKRI